MTREQRGWGAVRVAPDWCVDHYRSFGANRCVPAERVVAVYATRSLA